MIFIKENVSFQGEFESFPITMRFNLLTTLAALSSLCILADSETAPPRETVQSIGKDCGDQNERKAAEATLDLLESSLSSQLPPFFPEENCTKSEKNFNYKVPLRFPGMVDGSYGFSTGPDPMCAAGLSSVIGVTMLNVEIREKGGQLIDVKTLRDFFKVAAPPRNAIFEDPKVIYDSYFDLFLVMATLTDRRTFTDIYLAVSSTPEPFRATTDPDEAFWNWNHLILRVNEDGSQVVRYPGIAVDELAIYITGGLYTKSRRSKFVESRLWILNKNALYGVGQVLPTPVVSVDNPGGILLSETPLGAKDLDFDALPEIYMPAEIRSYSTKYDIFFGTYLVAYVWFNSEREPIQEFLHIYQVNDPLSNPPVLRSMVLQVEVEDETKPLPNATQTNGFFTKIDTLDRRVQNAVWNDESLWIALTVRDDSNPESEETSAYFFRVFAPSNITFENVTALEYGAAIDAEEVANSTSTFYPAIAVNRRNVAAIGFSAAGPNLYAGAYMTIHDELMEGPGETQCVQVVKAGENNYQSLDGNAIWGGYSGISNDPLIEDCFWLFNTYTNFSFPYGLWATHWAFMCVEESVVQLTGSDIPLPTTFPSETPSEFPSLYPSEFPTKELSEFPSLEPSPSPSKTPTSQPSKVPSDKPSKNPSSQPSNIPSAEPSFKPFQSPSSEPSSNPSSMPSLSPSADPSSQPSSMPSKEPSGQPSSDPSSQPSSMPSKEPSGQPSSDPSSEPSLFPSTEPSSSPSGKPSISTPEPVSEPSQHPSDVPSSSPSGLPSVAPSPNPSYFSSEQPSAFPSYFPSEQPSAFPSNAPCPKDQYMDEDGNCETVCCEACPSGTYCGTFTNETCACIRCNCGFCDEDNVACCKL